MYACGFEVGTPFTSRTGFDVLGRDGIRLSEYWAQGMRSLHGIHAHGFPNLFIVQPTQGANLISNVLHNLVEAGRTIAMVVARAGATGARQVQRRYSALSLCRRGFVRYEPDFLRNSHR